MGAELSSSFFILSSYVITDKSFPLRTLYLFQKINNTYIFICFYIAPALWKSSETNTLITLSFHFLIYYSNILIHLKYIELSWNQNITTIYSDICTLWNIPAFLCIYLVINTSFHFLTGSIVTPYILYMVVLMIMTWSSHILLHCLHTFNCSACCGLHTLVECCT